MWRRMETIHIKCWQVFVSHHSEALTRIGGLAISSIDTIVDKSLLPNEQGFICNSSSHWFTIRRVNGTWYNLNSTNKRMPEIIS